MIGQSLYSVIEIFHLGSDSRNQHSQDHVDMRDSGTGFSDQIEQQRNRSVSADHLAHISEIEQSILGPSGSHYRTLVTAIADYRRQ